MNEKLKDKLLLVLTGLSILIFGFVGLFYLRAIVSKDWADFIMMSVGYLIVLIYLTLSLKEFKKISKSKLLIFQVIFYLSTVSGAFLIFRYDLIKLPKNFHVYTLAAIVLSICSIIILKYLVKNSRLFKSGKR